MAMGGIKTNKADRISSNTENNEVTLSASTSLTVVGAKIVKKT